MTGEFTGGSAMRSGSDPSNREGSGSGSVNVQFCSFKQAISDFFPATLKVPVRPPSEPEPEPAF